MASRTLFLITLLSAMGIMTTASRLISEPNDFTISGARISNCSTELARVSLFEDWLTVQAKSYGDPTEKSVRFAIFKDNLRRINEHNSKQSSYTLGLTKFADLTHEEFKSLHLKTKFRKSLRSHQAPTFSYEHVNSDDLPAAVDWRKSYSHQGSLLLLPSRIRGCAVPQWTKLSLPNVDCASNFSGSCWAFSTIGAVEGINKIKTGKLVSLSEQELVSCAHTTNNTQGCEGGYMDYGFEFIIQNGGIDSEADYPYTAADDACIKRKEKDEVATISTYEDVPANKEEELKKAVAHQPVSVAIDAGDFTFQLYTGGIFDGPCGTDLDHGVVAVGYGTAAGDDFWIVKNSWGAQWGEQGYIRIQRNAPQAEGMCGIAMMASYPL